MKRLFVLRHADAEAPSNGVQDFDRPLSGRGRLNALRVGRAMAARGERPALALCSPAARARETLERLDDAAAQAVHRLDEEFYLAGLAQLHGILTQLEDTFATVLLVGHNPGLAALVAFLAGSGTDAAEARLGSGLPPAALAVLEFADGDPPGPLWSAVDRGTAHLADYRLPGDPITPAVD